MYKLWCTWCTCSNCQLQRVMNETCHEQAVLNCNWKTQRRWLIDCSSIKDSMKDNRTFCWFSKILKTPHVSRTSRISSCSSFCDESFIFSKFWFACNMTDKRFVSFYTMLVERGIIKSNHSLVHNGNKK